MSVRKGHAARRAVEARPPVRSCRIADSTGIEAERERPIRLMLIWQGNNERASDGAEAQKKARWRPGRLLCEKASRRLLLFAAAFRAAAAASYWAARFFE